MVLVRGVYMTKPRRDTHLSDAVMELVERNLLSGVAIILSSADVFKMARSGGYLLPGNVDPDNKPQLYGYCCSILYQLRPNHGSVRREERGKYVAYRFLPDVPKAGGLV